MRRRNGEWLNALFLLCGRRRRCCTKTKKHGRSFLLVSRKNGWRASHPATNDNDDGQCFAAGSQGGATQPASDAASQQPLLAAKQYARCIQSNDPLLLVSSSSPIHLKE